MIIVPHLRLKVVMLKLKAAESGCAHFEFTLPLKEDEIAIFQLITALHIPYFLLVLHLLGFRSALAMARRDAAANSEICSPKAAFLACKEAAISSAGL